jgi:hypothetical protein
VTQLLDDILGRLNSLPAKEKAQVVEDAKAVTKHMLKLPLEGPQTSAYLSMADVLLYGGQAGGGKTGLEVLLAQEHQHTIIFRREVTQTDGLERFGKEVYGTDGFNGSDLEWSWPDGRSLKLAGLKEPDSWLKHAGRARDLMEFDEAGEFLVEQVASLMAWNRAAVDPTSGKKQRCRIVLASNPPRTATGAWLIEWFAPWLTPNHPFKAEPGELRWAFMDPDKMMPIWVNGPEPQVREEGGEPELPLSFTFIPAALSDNPYNDTPEYRAKLNALPEPLRSQLKKGIFALGGEDHEWQMIPTAWIKAAQDRWKPKPPDGVPMCAIGADVAQGGGDDTALAPRYDGYYEQITVVPGAQTPGGGEVAGLVISKRKHGATIILDAGGGWGADAYGILRGDNRMTADECVAYMGVKPSRARSRDNLFKFFNMRSQLLWQFREALDPDQVGGSPIDLPPDNELLADLAAVRYEVVNRGHEGQFVKAEVKDNVCKRLGRSPNKGDAVVMSWYAGARAIARARPPSLEHGGRGYSGPQVNYGPRRQHGMRRH